MRLFFGIIGLIGIGHLHSQPIIMRRTTSPIKIDGVLDEPVWFESDSAYRFTQYFPSDTSLAEYQTVARILFDDENIYVSGVMYNPRVERRYITPSLRRDFRGEANDSFTVIFDPFKDRTNGMLFGINPFGVLREGLITDGGSGQNSFSLDWDNKWFGEAKQYPGYWVAEMSIPFKTLRFTEGQNEWLVNFYRVDSDNVERSTWSQISRNYPIVNLATMRPMIWEESTREPGANVSLIPYFSAGAFKDFEDNLPQETTAEIGMDIKYAVTPSLNLDVTVNPDFSQVEVDQQVTNLDRFEIFFPERRQFFLENADLFANFGNRGTRPFFSRRIGVAVDTATGQNFQNPIPLGVRLSGKVNNNLRIGLLSMQAGKDKSNGLPAYNYSVLTLQQKVLARSNVSVQLVNKQAASSGEAFDKALYSSYDRALATDFNLASKDNRWNGKAFFHYQLREDGADSSFASGVQFEYSVPELRWNVFSQLVGANYDPEVGFVRRQDIRQLASTVEYIFYPSSGIFQSHGPGFDFDMISNDTYGFLDYDVNILYGFQFRNSAQLDFRLRNQYTYLFDSFDPSGEGSDTELLAGTDYSNYMIVAGYNSDFRKNFFFSLDTRSGQYFNGTRMNLGGTVGYRYQPFGATSLDFEFNRIRLPQPYNSSNLILLGPRFDFTFTKSIFWTTFVQYNSQIENLNINSRFQWRFKPVSDIFIVYTDNYFVYEADNQLVRFGAPRARSLVFKITYWFNL